MKKRPTLADVARAAGVSLMTVSRAINGKAGVSEDVRSAIMTLAKELGYRPNQIARGLATSFTTSVGLVVPDNTNPFFAQIARGVEDTAYKQNYNIFLVNTAEDPAREKSALNSLSQRGVDGLILCSSRLPLEVLEEEISRFPAVVLVNRELGSSSGHAITINVNDQRGAHIAVRYLLDHGRERIAYLNGPTTSTSARRRLEGYKSAIQEANLPFDPTMVENCAPDTEGGRIAAAALFARHPDTNAIYAFNDLVAVGAIQIIEEINKRVPADVAVIGVDDIPLATIVRPQITTLHANLSHIGHLAMGSLLDAIEGGNSSTAILIEPELVVRDSA
jgi:LacI family transcriptional regulator